MAGLRFWQILRILAKKTGRIRFDGIVTHWFWIYRLFLEGLLVELPNKTVVTTSKKSSTFLALGWTPQCHIKYVHVLYLSGQVNDIIYEYIYIHIMCVHDVHDICRVTSHASVLRQRRTADMFAKHLRCVVCECVEIFVPILGLWPLDKAKRFPHGTIARLDFQREGWLPHMQPCPGKRVQINLLPPPNILHESYWTSIFSDVE